MVACIVQRNAEPSRPKIMHLLLYRVGDKQDSRVFPQTLCYWGEKGMVMNLSGRPSQRMGQDLASCLVGSLAGNRVREERHNITQCDSHAGAMWERRRDVVLIRARSQEATKRRLRACPMSGGSLLGNLIACFPD